MPLFSRNRVSSITKADLARADRDWNMAARHYAEALTRNPERPEIWVQYGHVLKEAGRRLEAEAAYRRAIEGNPASADAHLHLGHVLKLEGRREDAKPAYLRALALDPGLADARRALAELGLDEGQIAAARAALPPLPPPPRRRRPSRITRADRARELGQWAEAARLYREALDRNPRNAPIWVQYGHVLRAQGDLPAAETAYRHALAHDPKNADTSLQLGHALKDQGKTEEAQSAYLRAFALEPTDSEALSALRRLGWVGPEITGLRDTLELGMPDAEAVYRQAPPDAPAALPEPASPRAFSRAVPAGIANPLLALDRDSRINIFIGLTEHLGDIVACEPVVRYLKSRFPFSIINWVIFKPYRELTDTNPYIDRVTVVDCLTDWIKLTAHDKSSYFVDLHVNYRICQHCKVPLLKKFGNLFVDVNQYFDYGSIVEAFTLGAGLPAISGQPQVYIQDHHMKRVDELNLERNFCVVHKWSNNPEKDWTEARWNQLIDWLIGEQNLTVVEVGAGGRPGNAASSADRPNYVDLTNKTNILETAEVIRRAKIFLGVDSGPAHLANAVQTPGVVFLGKLGNFPRYTPFSGYYAESHTDVKLVRNPAGPVRDITASEVIDAASYVMGMTGERQPSSRRVPFRTPAPSTEITSQPAQGSKTALPKTYAFYLPQFHPIAENNAAHGMGFTEWHNVSKATPLFRGHYQPRIPGELGYYDLRAMDVMSRQVELAKEHGITGFCFYYYYFAGKRLLYTPIENYLRSGLDMPFFLMWANENWTKRWDGGDDEIIIKQEHSQDDDKYFLQQLLPLFADDRYVKINGKPLLFIYKAHLFPDIKRTTEIWREEVEAAGFPGIYLVMAEDWVPITHPREQGFDATYEIPSCVVPDQVNVERTDRLDILPSFQGRLVDYYKFAKYHLGRAAPEHKRFRTVMLPWDNTPRYREKAIVHLNTENDAYKLWLSGAYVDTFCRYSGEERLILLHSWNEWCEGTYLEPDGVHGRRFLEETRDALSEAQRVVELLQTGVSGGPETLLHLERIQHESSFAMLRAIKLARDEAAHLRGKLGEAYERLGR